MFLSSFRAAGAVLVLATGFPSATLAAASQVDPLSEVIVTGTKSSGDFGARSGIPLERMPQSVQVFSSEDIRALGALSIGDLLRGVPSANPGYSRVGPYQSFSLKVRGFLADQMRNGVRQRYYEDVDASALSNIERVEVLKGPSGVLYGQSAVGGIVSIITKQPGSEIPGALDATLGSFSQRLITGDLNLPVSEEFGLRLTGELERSGTFVDYQDLDRNNIAANLRYEFSDAATAHLVTEYVERNTKRYPGLPVVGTVRDNGVQELDRGLNLGEPAVDTLATHAPLFQAWIDFRVNDNWTLTPRVQYSEFNTTFLQIRLRSPQADLTTLNRNGRTGHEDDAYTIGQLDLTGSFITGAVTHKLLLGYEYDLERARFTQYNLTNVTPISVLNPVYSFDTVAPTKVFAFDQNYDSDGHALYAQDQIAMSDRWTLVASLRHSWIKAWTEDVGGPVLDTTDVQSTIWQLGTTYQLHEGLSLYGGYSTGFDIESTAGARSANGQPLEPEESAQLELGARLRTGNFRGSAALFEIRRKNALTTDPLDPDYSINTGEQRVRGLELEGEWAPGPNWSLSGGYAYLDGAITKSNDGDVGLGLGDVPDHTLTLRTSVQVPGTGLTFRGGVSYVSERLLTNASSVELPAYWLLDVGASWQLSRFRFDLMAENLADERYFAASGNAFAVMPGDPRSIRLRVGTFW
jgi:iron complex outermembrane recepter protein